MDEWLVIWKVLLIGAFILFGILAIAVAFGGFFDIRSMFKKVDDQHHAPPDDTIKS
ncbi:MAG: hypothetical protein ACYTF1_13685 [Planctomycetota bacterium]|jgi:hypothetical protein